MNTNKKQTIGKFYINLILCSIGLIWFSQDSINSYWQQTYHENSPLQTLDKYSWWKIGSQTQTLAKQKYNLLSDWLNNSETIVEEHLLVDENSVKNTAPEIMPENEIAVVLENGNSQDAKPVTQSISQSNESEQLPIESSVASTINIKQDTPLNNDSTDNSLSNAQEISQSAPLVYPDDGTKVILQKSDKVLFAGDSLMQGVAPFVQQYLRKQYAVDSINLSKQSTGLSYPSFFDWPKTIEQTLAKEKKIKLLVVFLGPNDPWDFPNPKGGYKYLKFKSPEWEEEYSARIQRILDAAAKAEAKVIWLGVPFMKAQKLNEQLRYLETVLQKNLANKTIWLPTERLLSNDALHFADSIKVNGKTVRVRSKDGIHFTPAGQKLLAEYIQQHIVVSP